MDTANFNWGNDVLYDFSLSFNGSISTFTVGGTSVSYDTFDFATDFDGLALRISTFAGQSVQFSNLVFDGESIADFGLDNSSDSRMVQWLLISDAGDLSQGFEITGSVAMGWDTTVNLSQSRLAFQFKGADITTSTPPVTAVPEPGTLLLLGAGLLGVSRFRRKK